MCTYNPRHLLFIYSKVYNIYIHRQVLVGITLYGSDTSHVILLCLALGVLSISQPTATERFGLATRTFECDPY